MPGPQNLLDMRQHLWWDRQPWGWFYHLYPINDSFDEQIISMSSCMQYSHRYPRPGVNAQRWTGFTLNLPSNLSLHSSFVINSTVAFLNVAFSSLILLSAQLLFTLFLPGVMLSFSLESKDLMEGLSAAITWQQLCNGHLKVASPGALSPTQK